MVPDTKIFTGFAKEENKVNKRLYIKIKYKLCQINMCTETLHIFG